MNAVPSDFSFQRPGGFHASGLARKAIAQCRATIAKTICIKRIQQDNFE